MTTNKTVLVVDDDRTILRVSRSFLERLEIEVHQAESGNEARSLLEAGLVPDVILTDLNMPEGSGADLLAFVRSYPATSDLPVIVITGTSDEREVEQLWTLGCTEVYRKPVRYDVLLDRVAEFIDLDVRRAIRYAVDLEVNLPLAGRVAESKASNLSTSGVFLVSDRRLDPSEIHEVVLRLPFPTGAELVTMNVEVVREARVGDDRFGYGARFLPDEGDQRRMLCEYLRFLEG